MTAYYFNPGFGDSRSDKKGGTLPQAFPARQDDSDIDRPVSLKIELRGG
jgi:hypothetical protein